MRMSRVINVSNGAGPVAMARGLLLWRGACCYGAGPVAMERGLLLRTAFFSQHERGWNQGKIQSGGAGDV